MNPLTHYQTLAAQAEAHKLAQTASTNLAAAYGRERFLEHLKNGVDHPMPTYIAGRAYKISTHLGECSRVAQAALFTACWAALSETDARTVKDLLATFARLVAREYGEDSEEVWADAVGDE